MRRAVRTALACLVLFAAAPAPAQTRPPASAGELSLSFAPVVRAAAPAVVNIYATRVVARRASPFAGDPFFERFFGQLMPQGRQIQNALGSGVIVGRDGLVVTNFHVAGGAQEIRVVLADRREFAAEVILADERSDLAVLRLAGASDLPTLRLRDSDALEVGDLVLAIGNPFGVGQTVTSGIISALARSSATPGGRAGYFIQTDAAINPGNSGGALVDMQGRLVGVNTAILSRSGGSIGIGFAVPSNLVAQVVAQAEAGRSTLTRPWAGIVAQPVDGALADALGLPAPEGLLIAEAHPASPFLAAGLRRGDVLLSLGGQAVSTPSELAFRLASLGIGATAQVAYMRDGRRSTARIALAAPPEDPPRDLRRLGGRSPLAGLTVANLNPALGQEIGAPPTAQGVVALAAEGAPARAGLRRGDLIRAVNGLAVNSAADLAATAARARLPLDIAIERDGRAGVLRLRG